MFTADSSDHLEAHKLQEKSKIIYFKTSGEK